MSLPVTPRPGQYIIEKDPHRNETVTESGLILAHTEGKAISSGVITQRNDEVWPVGTRVYFSPWAGFTLSVNRKDYIQISEHEILGSFEQAAEVYVS